MTRTFLFTQAAGMAAAVLVLILDLLEVWR